MQRLPAYNQRRFFRLDTRLPLYFAAEEAVYPRQIFALRTEYFSPHVHHQVAQTKARLHHWLAQVQEHRATLEQIFSEMEGGLDFFGSLLTYITEGIHPKTIPNVLFQFQRWKQGFASLHLLEHNAPKTYTFIRQIEEKFKYYLGCLEEMVQKSNENYLHTQKSFKVAFSLEESLELLRKPGFSRNPLAQSILAAAELMELFIQVFHDINYDHAYRNSPELWPVMDVNASGGGLAFHTSKGYKQHQMLDIGIYLPMMQRTARFKGRIVYIVKDPDNAKPPRIAVNFEFPDGHDQRALISELQRHELAAADKLRPFKESNWYLEVG